MRLSLGFGFGFRCLLKIFLNFYTLGEKNLNGILSRHHDPSEASEFLHLQKRRLSMLRVGHKQERQSTKHRSLLLEGVATKRRASPIRESEDDRDYGADFESDFSLSNLEYRFVSNNNNNYHYCGDDHRYVRSPRVVTKDQQAVFSPVKCR